MLCIRKGKISFALAKFRFLVAFLLQKVFDYSLTYGFLFGYVFMKLEISEIWPFEMRPPKTVYKCALLRLLTGISNCFRYLMHGSGMGTLKVYWSPPKKIGTFRATVFLVSAKSGKVVFSFYK